MVALSLLIVVIVLVLKLTDTLWNIEPNMYSILNNLHILKLRQQIGSRRTNSSAKQRFSIGIEERQQCNGSVVKSPS